MLFLSQKNSSVCSATRKSLWSSSILAMILLLWSGLAAATITFSTLPPQNSSILINAGDVVAFTLRADSDILISKVTIAMDSGPEPSSFVANNDVEFATGDFSWDSTGAAPGIYTAAFSASENGGEPVTISFDIVVNNDAPVAVDDPAEPPPPLPVLSVNEGTAFNISISTSLLPNDSDVVGGIDPASFTVVGEAVNGSVAVSSGNPDLLIYTHDGSETTSGSFAYQVSDIYGEPSNLATVNITVIPMNDPPVAGNDTATVSEGGTVDIDVIINDNDPDPSDAIDMASVEIVTQPVNGQINYENAASNLVSSTGIVSYTHSGDQTTTDSFQYIVRDSGGVASNVATVSIDISGVNDAPLITGQTQVSTQEEVSIDIQFEHLQVFDPDNTYPIGFALTVGSGANYANTGNTITPVLNFFGTLSVPVVVYDGAADSNTFYLQVEVTNTDDPPKLTAIADQSVAENKLLTIDVSATDPDGTIPSLTAVTAVGFPANTNAGFTDNGDGTGVFTWTPGFSDSENPNNPYEVTFTASDDVSLSDSQGVVITVTNTNQSPIIEAIVDQSGAEDQLLEFAVSASDLDGDPITLTTGNSPVWAWASFTDNGDGTGTFSGTPGPDDGNDNPTVYNNVTFIASDGNAADDASEVITISIDNTNRLPEFIPISTQTGSEGTDFAFSVNAFDDDNDPLTISCSHDVPPAGNPPSCVDLGNGVASVTWSPNFNQNGSYTFTFIANDGQSDSQPLNVAVIIGGVNREPVFTTVIDPQIVAENTAPTINVSATDPDAADVLSFSLDALTTPAFVTITSDDGAGNAVIQMAPGYEDEGVYQITVEVNDNSSEGTPLNAKQTFDLTVTNTNRAPTISSVGNVNVGVGKTRIIEILVSDPDVQDILTVDAPVALPSFAILEQVQSSDKYTLTISPPLDAEPGQYPVTLRVRDGSNPQKSDSVSGTITVTTFSTKWLGFSSDWHDPGNWDPWLPGSTDNVFIPVTSIDPVLSANVTVTGLKFENGAELNIGANQLFVQGNLAAGNSIIAAGGEVLMLGDGVSLSGTVPNLVISGAVDAAGDVFINGDLDISSNGRLNVGGRTVSVSGNLGVLDSGTLAMENTQGLMTVGGDAYFNGGGLGDLLSAGELRIKGNFAQSNVNGASRQGFRSTGSHLVVLNGTSLQTVNFSDPDRRQSRFQELVIGSGANVEFISDVAVEASLVNYGAMALKGSPSIIVSVRGLGMTNEVGAILSGIGTIDVSASGPGMNNSGEIAPGLSAGILTIDGDLKLTSSSVLMMELGGSSPGTGYDQLQITGNASLGDVSSPGGLLNVSLINGYQPIPGAQFDLLTTDGNTTGAFGAELLPVLDPALDWQFEYLSKAVRMSVIFSNPATEVNSTDDIYDGNCDAEHCSLREAIVVSNVTPGSDVIVFNISGAGPHTIQLGSPLPDITGKVIVDASSQPGIFTGNTRRIELDGSGAGSADGFRVLSGSGTTIKGFAINGFSGNGIVLSEKGGNFIEENFIGTDPTGTVAVGNAGSGLVISNVPGNQIGIGNIFAANNVNGIRINGVDAFANIIQGNAIGTNLKSDTLQAGELDLGNGQSGIAIADGVDNLVGGDTIALANIIAFNGGDGIRISGTVANDIVVNQIDANDGLGIDVSTNGVNTNDAPELDGVQNFPLISTATAGVNSVSGDFLSMPEQTYSLRFFMSETCDGSGNGEGAVYLGETAVTTDVAGNAAFNFTSAVEMVSGYSVSATALGVDGTSEFSPCATVDLAPPDLMLTKTSLGVFVVGVNGKYKFEIVNVGTGANTGTVTVTDVLPASLAYVAAGNDQWSCGVDGQTVSCVSTMAIEPNQASAFELEVSVFGDAVPGVTNSATVATVADYNSGNDSSSVTTQVSTFSGPLDPKISPESIPQARVGLPYSVTFDVSGGLPPYDISIVADVPGLHVDGNRLFGAPEAVGEYEVIVNVQDNNVPPGEASKSYILKVTDDGGVAVATASLDPAVLGASYSYLLKGIGGTEPYSWKATSALPPGLTLISTGQLSGIPTAAGTFSLNVMMRDRNGDSAAATLELLVKDFGLVNVTPVLPAALKDAAYTVPMLISGGVTPYECLVISGIVPPGLDLNNCIVRGTPTDGGTFSFVVRFSDSSGPALSVDASFSIKVVNSAEADLNATPKFRSLDDGGVQDVSAELGKGSPDGSYPDENLQSMATDAYGNQYVVGYAYNGDRYVVHVIKFDIKGEMVWHQLLDTGIHSYGYGISVAPDQSVYVGGFTLQGNVYRGLVARFDHSGTQQWVKHYKQGKHQTDVFYKLVADDSGVYAVGESYNGNNFDALIAKYSPEGEMLWKQLRQGVDNDTAYAVDLACVAESCGVVVGGTSGHDASRNGWLMELGPDSGDIISGRDWAGDFVVEDIAVDSESNVIVAGTANDGSWRLQKLNSAFAPLWGVDGISYSGDDEPGNHASRLRSVAVDRGGFIYGAGHRSQNGDDDVLLVVFDPDGSNPQALVLDERVDEPVLAQEAHGIVVDANQRVVVSGQVVSDTGSEFLLLYVNTGKCLDNELIGCQAATP